MVVKPIYSTQITVPVKWKLLDESGLEMPLLLLNRSLATTEFTLQVEDNGSTESYAFYCEILCYPPSLSCPQSFFFSLEKFGIRTDYSRSPRLLPKIRCRKQGEEKWNLIEKQGGGLFTATIKHKDDVHEVQAFYELNGEPFLSSPILVVYNHWQKFDMKKNCEIDLEQLLLKKIFRAKLDFQQSDLMATIQLLNNNGFAVAATEIELKKEEYDTTNWFHKDYYTNFTSPELLPGQYQVNIAAKDLGIQFAHIITVVDDGKQIWPKIFGSNADAVTFSLSSTDARKNAEHNAGTPCEYHRNLQLLSNGLYKYDFTKVLQNWFHAQKTELGFSGKFKVIDENQYRAVIGLYPDVRRNDQSRFTPRIPLPYSILTNIDDQRESPAAFLPEIINKIALTVDGPDPTRLRLVCKKWLKAIPLALIIVVTSTRCTIDAWDLGLPRS